MIDWITTYGNYLLIPFIAAFAGWVTNWLAIKMTFYPLEYVGRFPFGWRGVVPSNIRKFSVGMVDTTIGKIGGLPAIVDAVDLEEAKSYLLETARPMIAEAVQDMLHERIASQPPAEFQDLIRPIFHQDEWILVAIGGALGALVGWGQLILLFGERLLENGAPIG